VTVCAIIISYYPTEEIVGNVSALLGQVNEIVIVDNGSGHSSQEIFKRLSLFPRLTVIYNGRNLGVAAALNLGVQHAKAGRHQWVWTFDQDSTVTAGMLSQMLQAYESYPRKEVVASLSPRYRDKATGGINGSRLKAANHEGTLYAEALVVITSGNLVKLDVFDVVGGYNEALFIDQVDNEFCLRCATYGYRILEINGAVLDHCVGSPVQHRLLWKRPIATNHNALRRYYITRNGIYVYKKYLLRFPGWVLQDARTFLQGIVIMILFEHEKVKKLAATCRGIFHGVTGRMGKLEA